MKIALKVRFDGSMYSGFQVQPNADTVQKRLNEACKLAFGYECNVSGCSRTDSGVHAREFVCSLSPHNFDAFSSLAIPEARIHRVMNQHLPSDISVIGAAFMDDSFHPRYDAIGKEYVYRIYSSVSRDPFLDRTSWHLPVKIPQGGIEIMSEVCDIFKGKHDFKAFMASGSSVANTVRAVSSARIDLRDGLLEFSVSADGFLYNMVRIMTGTLVDCCFGRVLVKDVERALFTGERELLGKTAPAHGLTLNRVFYDYKIEWKAE